MRKWIGLAAAILLAGPAAAIEVECPGGTWYGDDVRNCPCCEICRDGTWRAEGDEPCMSFSEAAAAALEAMPDSKRYKTMEPAGRGVALSLVDSVWTLIVGAFVFALCFALYFLPFILAKSRKHHQSDAILLTNLFLGWTALGWVVAMIWAATATEGKKG